MEHQMRSQTKKVSASRSGQQQPQQHSTGKKWSIGRFFRRKKTVMSNDSSSDDDRNAGFIPAQKNSSSRTLTALAVGGSGGSSNHKSRTKSNHGSKSVGAVFDHIVQNPLEITQSSIKPSPLPQSEVVFFLPLKTVTPKNDCDKKQLSQQQSHLSLPGYGSRSSCSLDRRSKHYQSDFLSGSHNNCNKNNNTNRSTTRLLPRDKSGLRSYTPTGGNSIRSSSGEDIISLNSTTFAKFCSDENIPNGSVSIEKPNTNCDNIVPNSMAQNRRSRAARNERYYKRLSRDGEVSHNGLPSVVLQNYSSQQQPEQQQQHHLQPSQNWQNNLKQSSCVNHHLLANTGSLDQISSQSMPNQDYYNHLRHHQHTHISQQHQQQQQQQHPIVRSQNIQNSSMICNNKRSISYDSQIHQQNLKMKNLPPPPPPRNPTRRVMPATGEIMMMPNRNVAMESSVSPSNKLRGGRWVSDERVWAANERRRPQSNSLQSLNSPLTVGNHYQNPQQLHLQQQRDRLPHRRFITRSDKEPEEIVNDEHFQSSHPEFHYVADSLARSRKSIHQLEQYQPIQCDESKNAPVIIRTSRSGLISPSPPRSGASEFWKRLDEGQQTTQQHQQLQRPKATQPNYNRISRKMSLYSDIEDSMNNNDIICGSLSFKPGPGQIPVNSSVEIRNINNNTRNKSNAMSNRCDRRSTADVSAITPMQGNKYDEYVAEKREKHQNTTVPSSKINPEIRHQKPTNLEEAINELEAIYRSLDLSQGKAEKSLVEPIQLASAKAFDAYAASHADEYDEMESPTGEPDPIRDDVANRNLRQSAIYGRKGSSIYRAELPFGIPIDPVLPSVHADYLHIQPNSVENALYTPDIVRDDFAVRNLRKDPLVGTNNNDIYRLFLASNTQQHQQQQKKKRAIRSQSANIHSLIQRDAAKPSGGDLLAYLELATNNNNNVNNKYNTTNRVDYSQSNSTADISNTLALLHSLRDDDQDKMKENCNLLSREISRKITTPQIPFRHSTCGGAIAQLPEKLYGNMAGKDIASRVCVKSTTTTPIGDFVNNSSSSSSNGNNMDEALNQIAKQAKQSSEKLSHDLKELRRERRSLSLSSTTPTKSNQNIAEVKLRKELQDIEAVSQAAKRCGQMLLDTLPNSSSQEVDVDKTKLRNGDHLIQAIDLVSEAANAVCAEILKDLNGAMPTGSLPDRKLDENDIQINKKNSAVDGCMLVMPNLIKKLDPMQSQKIEAIAQRCLRQISELADQPDTDNAKKSEGAMDKMKLAMTAVACNVPNATCGDLPPEEKQQMSTVDSILSTLAEKSSTRTMQELEDKSKSKSHIDEVILKSSGSPDNPSQMMISGPILKTNVPPISIEKTSDMMKINDIHTATASSTSWSSDNLPKSSSPSANRPYSTSITSFNPFSSSDYIKSPSSSDYHAPSTDPIKTFSTTSYDGPSTNNDTPNYMTTPATTTTTTTDTCSYSLSPPPLNLSPVSCDPNNADFTYPDEEDVDGNIIAHLDVSSPPSQYNSSEELAMIFGIEEKTKQPKVQQSKTQQQDRMATKTGKNGIHNLMKPTSASTACARNNATSDSIQITLDCVTARALPQRISLNELRLLLPAMPVVIRNAAVPHKIFVFHRQNHSKCQCLNQTISNTRNANKNSMCAIKWTYDMNTTFNFKSVIEFIISSTFLKLILIPHSSTNHCLPALLFTNNVDNNILHTSHQHHRRLVIIHTNIFQQEQEESFNQPSTYTQQTIMQLFDNKMTFDVNLTWQNKQDQKNFVKLMTELNKFLKDNIPFISSYANANLNISHLAAACCCDRPIMHLMNNFYRDFEVRNLFVRKGLESLETIAYPTTLKEANVFRFSRPLTDGTIMLDNFMDNLLKQRALKIITFKNKKQSVREIAKIQTENYDQSISDDENLDSIHNRLPRRLACKRQCVVIETPQLQLNIAESKINVKYNEKYIDSIGNTDKIPQNFENKSEFHAANLLVEKLPKIFQEQKTGHLETDQMNRNQNFKDRGVNMNIQDEWLQEISDCNPSNANYMKNCSVSADCSIPSSKSAYSILGKIRSLPQGTLAVEEDAAALTNSFTTLEQIIVACSIGVISPNDLFTLCLIVIGLITIIAIILF